MVNVRERTKSFDSPRGEVGEIDTTAPFQSVKAAVSLFGETVPRRKSIGRKSTLSAENVLDKETQLVLVQGEFDMYKQHLEIAEATKAQAISELEMAKSTMNDLTTKIKTLIDLKQSANEAAEATKKKSKQLEVAKSHKQSGIDAQKHKLDEVQQQYNITSKELDATKQEVTKIRQDLEAILEAKRESSQRAIEAQRVANVSTEKVKELSEQIKAIKESYQQLKFASTKAQEQRMQIVTENDANIHACKIGKEEAIKMLEALKSEYNPDFATSIEVKLVETTIEIEVLQEEMKKAHAFEMEEIKVLTMELDEATKVLQALVHEESCLRNTMTSIRQELENVKREQSKLSDKEKESKIEKEKMDSELEQLLSETIRASKKVEEIKKNVDEFRQEARNAKLIAQDFEKDLELALREKDEAEVVKGLANEEMKALSNKRNIQNGKIDNKIKISLEEFNAMKNKVLECKNFAEIKEENALTQVKLISMKTEEMKERLEANLKAIEEIKEEIENTLKSTEMSEAAQSMVEGELTKWRQGHEPDIA